MFILRIKSLKDESDGFDGVKPSLSDTAPLCSEKSQDEKDYNFEEINKYKPYAWINQERLLNRSPCRN